MSYSLNTHYKKYENDKKGTPHILRKYHTPDDLIIKIATFCQFKELTKMCRLNRKLYQKLFSEYKRRFSSIPWKITTWYYCTNEFPEYKIDAVQIAIGKLSYEESLQSSPKSRSYLYFTTRGVGGTLLKKLCRESYSVKIEYLDTAGGLVIKDIHSYEYRNTHIPYLIVADIQIGDLVEKSTSVNNHNTASCKIKYHKPLKRKINDRD
ncbi:MAG: hypothetical protein Solumvirus1_50 [Solumvirus sp.]|uniref:F-box domain-containing protein n=1 Tax=Solumvirus sp. TaxID=2487773 RepID=A0A3G5AG38_9VIRU|nr:MAG: hypothetical protein Solumvirus1_50 [Solumvirus sp.]